jgi:para-aminobenzoate synthetase component 1
MRPILEEVQSAHSPETLVEAVGAVPGTILLRSGFFEGSAARYSFVAARPFLTFRSNGSSCELRREEGSSKQFWNPWRLLEGLMARYELLDQLDLPFPTGGCFGYWGYDLKSFVEPVLTKLAVNDLELPDCHAGFYGSLAVFDHWLDKKWIIATGLAVDGSRSLRKAEEEIESWRQIFDRPAQLSHTPPLDRGEVRSNMGRAEFISAVRRAQEYIRQGDIYQVNLAQRLECATNCAGWNLFTRLSSASPAPFSAYLHAGDFELASSSPESFLRMSGSHIQTRPIKGTRPRSNDPIRDAQLTYELQTSPKEMAELVMITDLLRNDLGRVCEYGSVLTPELVRLERYPQVQHLVSTIEGTLRADQTHYSAFASCFPGGSITGAPKIRAMNIIDELEPVTRGPYSGALGYLGFNRESQLSIVIRTAVLRRQTAYFHAGAGIVADSVPEAEYDETLAKAAGFLRALELPASVGEPDHRFS